MHISWNAADVLLADRRRQLTRTASRWRRAARRRVMASSMVTPTRIAAPMTMYSNWLEMSRMFTRFRSSTINAVARITANTFPVPPRRLHPPSTAPAIAYNS